VRRRTPSPFLEITCRTLVNRSAEGRPVGARALGRRLKQSDRATRSHAAPRLAAEVADVDRVQRPLHPQRIDGGVRDGCPPPGETSSVSAAELRMIRGTS
jgi:hypothetical protein